MVDQKTPHNFIDNDWIEESLFKLFFLTINHFNLFSKLNQAEHKAICLHINIKCHRQHFWKILKGNFRFKEAKWFNFFNFYSGRNEVSPYSTESTERHTHAWSNVIAAAWLYNCLWLVEQFSIEQTFPEPCQSADWWQPRTNLIRHN